MLVSRFFIDPFLRIALSNDGGFGPEKFETFADVLT